MVSYELSTTWSITDSASVDNDNFLLAGFFTSTGAASFFGLGAGGLGVSFFLGAVFLTEARDPADFFSESAESADLSPYSASYPS